MLKHGGEVDEIRRSKNRKESKITNQILACPYDNKTTGGLNESGLPRFGKNANREFTTLILANSYLPADK